MSIMRNFNEKWQDLMVVYPPLPHITDVPSDLLPVHHPDTILESWPEAPAG